MSKADYTAEQRVLFTIATTSHKIGHLLNSLPSQSRTTSPTYDCRTGIASQSFILPEPRPLTRELVSRGLDCPTAERVSDAYLRAACRLKAACEVRYGRAKRAWYRLQGTTVDGFGETLESTYTSQYLKALESWVTLLFTEITPHTLENRPDNSHREVLNHQRSFDQRVTSVLEEAFNCDAFPSRALKKQLALEAGLHYKQVHVWNRRQRLRRNENFFGGPSVSKLLPDHPDFPVETTLKEFHVSSALMSGYSEAIMLQDSELNPSAPPHAFPSVYPPQCDYDPFPVRDEITHFPTPWPKTRRVHQNTRSSPIDVTQLTRLFSGLTLDEGDIDSTSTQCAPSIGFSTKTPSAPLPALIVSRDIRNARCIKPTQSGKIPIRTPRCLPRSGLRTSRKSAPFNMRLPGSHRSMDCPSRPMRSRTTSGDTGEKTIQDHNLQQSLRPLNGVANRVNRCSTLSQDTAVSPLHSMPSDVATRVVSTGASRLPSASRRSSSLSSISSIDSSSSDSITTPSTTPQSPAASLPIVHSKWMANHHPTKCDVLDCVWEGEAFYADAHAFENIKSAL